MMKKKLVFGGLIITALAMACNNSGESSSSADTASIKTDSSISSAGSDTGMSKKQPQILRQFQKLILNLCSLQRMPE